MFKRGRNIKYVKPEVVDLTGIDAFGANCTADGSHASPTCYSNGNVADDRTGSGGCLNQGLAASPACLAGGANAL